MSEPEPSHMSASALRQSLANTKPSVLWLDSADRPAAEPSLGAVVDADLVVVGGGFVGLWSALRARERGLADRVVVLEGQRVGWAASGRNGGFCSSSLTHGIANGCARWPTEMETLERLGKQNLDEIEATISRHGIDCHFERTGTLDVAVAAWQTEELADHVETARRLGHDVELLDAAQTRARVDSPTYLGGVLTRHSDALVDPARLAWGLAHACRESDVAIFEHTRVQRVDSADEGVVVTTQAGEVRARHAVLATNALDPLLRRVSSRVIPVWDYVLATEPLTADQLHSIGWQGREGVGDLGNQFHYYRLTADDRIVFGGYDAIYEYGSRTDEKYAQRRATFELLARHFLTTFPQLEGIEFTHSWGGVIDTCTRFSAFFGRARGGRVAYAAGFTGLGVGASRFAADVMLDLLHGLRTERTDLRMVRMRPPPFPPEPLRKAVVELTRRSIARADANGGRRNLWLRTLDRLGLGFDS